MSLISDPYKSFKDQAIRIWETKDFAERLAFSTGVWFQSILLTLLGIAWLNFLIYVAVNDLLTLANFYSGDVWYLEALQDLWQQTQLLLLALIFFWTCPRIVRFSLTMFRAYINKRKGMFQWLETKIKLRFPDYKTSAQISRERAEKTVKPNKLQKWIRKQPPLERRFIRISIASFFGVSMFFMMGYVTNPDMVEWILTGEKPVKEVPPEPTLDEELANQPIPKQPDGRPPSTIYDIFIRQSNTVFP